MSDLSGEDSEIDAEITALKAKKKAKLLKERKAEAIAAKERATVLVQASPAKKRSAPAFQPPIKKDIKPSRIQLHGSLRSQAVPELDKPRPSTLVTSFNASRSSSAPKLKRVVERSTSFKQDPVKEERAASDDEGVPADWKNSHRDGETLTVKVELVPGPREFGLDSEGLNEWRAIEPNSGIRLSARKLSHSLLQAHLESRYYIAPSLIYSMFRLGRDGQSYDLPIEGDWVTIAVVAERSEVRITAGDSSFSSKAEEDNEDVVQSDEDVKPTLDRHGMTIKPKSTKKRKFVSLTLCAMPARDRKAGTAGGDALLKLLLFEVDSVSKNTDGTKQFRGGSGGAFEKWSNLARGSVVAILNPRVFPPLKGGPLALSPTSADAVSLIGLCRDLGVCKAMKKDGKRCSDWIDSRYSSVCDYHLSTAVKDGRNARAEFSNNTATFTSATRSGPLPGRQPPTRKGEYDPSRKKGLLPRFNIQVAPRQQADGGGGATYVVGGNVVSTEKQKRYEVFGEHMGRGDMSRKKRKLEEEHAEEELKKLLKSESGGSSMGAQYLRAARRTTRDNEKADGDTKGKARRPASSDDDTDGHDGRKRPFSLEAVRRIGFNPTIKGSAANVGESAEAARKRIESIMELQHHKPKLGRIPGAKIRSGVTAPITAIIPNQTPASFLNTLKPSTDMVDLESSDLD